MTTINLRELYPWYTEDTFIEVSDEVAAFLEEDKRLQINYAASPLQSQPTSLSLWLVRATTERSTQPLTRCMAASGAMTARAIRNPSYGLPLT